MPPPASRERPRRRARRALAFALAALAVVALALVALAGYVASERGLAFLVARIVAQSGGRIAIEGSSGSVAGTMRFRRIVWRGPDATVAAEDVVVDWSPGALWSRRLAIRGLGAHRVSIALAPSSGAAAPPPTDLRLPLAVDVDRLAVGEIDWHVGPRSGRILGLEFGYSGDAAAHRV